jgi:hypothetical protein
MARKKSRMGKSIKSKKSLVKKDSSSLKINVNDILGGVVNVGRDSKTGKEIVLDDNPRDYKAEIEKVPENERVQTVSITNPATGETTNIVIDRRGMFDEKLGGILVDKNKTDDEKLSAISLYLFERGKESSSFLVDLIASKGQFFKGAQQFKSQIRFDLNVLLETIYDFLFSMAKSIFDDLGISSDASEVEEEAFYYLKDNESETLSDFVRKKFSDLPNLSGYDIIFIKMALQYASEAKLIKKRMEEISEERERERGKGIFINKQGRSTDDFSSV